MPNLEKIAVVGVGLIGASLAAALKKSESKIEITAVDRDAETIKQAENLGIIDQGFTEISDNLKKAELIFIAVPVAAIPTVIREIKNGSKNKQILVDAGSTKKEIMLQAEKILKDSKKIFIGGHPMAGSHKSGLNWHDPELFREAPFILTPWIRKKDKVKSVNKFNHNSSIEAESLEQLKILIKKMGARVHIISAEEHDRCTAYLSHLPHLLSSALVNLSEKKEFKEEFLELSGSGYRDMTRIAGSSPELWQDIIISNSSNLVDLIEKYIKELKKLKLDLKNNDQNKIYDFLAKAAEIKNKDS